MLVCKFFGKGLIANFYIFFFFLAGSLFADDVDYNLKVYGYSHHLQKDWFFHPGVQVDRDSYVDNWLVYRSSIAMYRDSGDLVGGFFHMGFRVNIRKFKNLYIRLGVGPTFIWRQNWWIHRDSYDGNTFYGETYHDNQFESNFIWLGGDFEFEWQLESGKRFIFACVPGYPVIFANSIGFRF